MIFNTRPYRVVAPFGLFKIDQILEWDKEIARPHVQRGVLQPVVADGPETAMVDPGGEKAVTQGGRPRGRPRGRRAKHANP